MKKHIPVQLIQHIKFYDPYHVYLVDDEEGMDLITSVYLN